MLSDRELIARILCGEVEAAEEFVERFGRFVFSILVRTMRLSKESAEDVFQQVWVHLWKDDYRRLRGWRGEGPFVSYLAVMVRRLACDYLRAFPDSGHLDPHSRDREGDANPLEPPTNEPNAEELAFSQEVRAAAQEALGILKARDRELIERRHFYEQSYREIAEAMDMTVTNVGVALSRAEDRLRSALKDMFPELLVTGEKSG